MMQTQIINELLKLAQLFLVRVEKQDDLRKNDLLKMFRMFLYSNVKYCGFFFFIKQGT